MFTHTSRQVPHLRPAVRKTGTRLDRLAAVLIAVTCGLLASAAIIPAAFARVVPDPGGQYGPIRTAPASAATSRVVTVGGMAGWQIILIAVGAALVAATAAVLLDRTLAVRRAASATTT
jgi:hypothetical protein